MDIGTADPLAAGELAAFHGSPGRGVAALERVVDGRLATPEEASKARWLLGVCLGAEGRYGQAFAALTPLGEEPVPGDRWSCFAAATLGSLDRQLGRYAAAGAHDEDAVAAAGTLPPADLEPAVDAHLGLAADAVGVGDLPAARESWDRAAELADRPDTPWRPRVRLAWVQAEIALLAGDPAAAQQAAERALGWSDEGRAPRHRAKSLLVLGVSRRERGDHAAAALALRSALGTATELGALPLIWPSGTVLAELLAAAPEVSLYPTEADRAAEAARRAVGGIASALPEELVADWLARPGVPSP